MQYYIQKLLSKNPFSEQESYLLFQALDVAPIEQQAAVLALLQLNTPTAKQLEGARQYLFEHTKKISCPYDVVDIVGTGGDSIGTFNISTAASLVLASCDIYVAKHGGKSVTSQSGSADVMTCLNFHIPQNNQAIIDELEKNKFVYLSAGLFNLKLSHFKNLRKKLGIPSIFNLLGPLMNPLQPKRAVIGVYKKELMLPIISTLKNIGYIHALVIHSYDGLDEMSISAPTYVSELKNGFIQNYVITPEELKLNRANLDTVLGSNPMDNAQIITQVLTGELQGPKHDIVILNAAAGLLVADKVPNLVSGIEMAKQAILSKKAAKLLFKLRKSN